MNDGTEVLDMPDGFHDDKHKMMPERANHPTLT
jgi:hypothetical protein